MGDKKHKRDDAQEHVEKHEAFLGGRHTLDGVRSNVEEVLSRIRWPMWWPWAPIEPSSEEPETDVFDMETEFKVIIDLPGIAKQDVEISVTRDTVEIAAEKAEEPAKQQGKYISRERDCTSFKRVLALSEEVIPDETEASFENGTLTIILKKKPPAPTRERVKVSVK